MATATLDVEYLSAYLSVPEQTLTTIVDTPTADLVRSVLEAITTRAREHDELVADKLRADIELENAVRSSETRVEGLRATIEKSQKTVEEVRTKLKEEGKKIDLGVRIRLLMSYPIRKRKILYRRRAANSQIVFHKLEL
jgi:nucleoprotein TPR